MMDNQTVVIKLKLGCCFLALIASLFVYFYYWFEASIFLEKRLFSNNKILYDVASFDLPYNEISAFQATVESEGLAYLKMDMTAKPNGFEAFPNLFQTAPFNDGIRLEFGADGSAALIIGYRNFDKYKVLPLANKFVVGRTYDISLEALNNRYISVFIDGKREVFLSTPELNFSASDIRFGSGFDMSRQFDGDLEFVSIEYGAITYPKIGKLMVDIVSVVCLTFLVFVIGKILSVSKPFQRFYAQSLIVVLPAIILVWFVEHSLAFTNTSYLHQKMALEDKAASINTLVLGSSTAVYGVDPKEFSKTGFNLATLGNAVFFDAQIAKKYSHKLQNLDHVIFVLNYFTLGLDYSEFSQEWRKYFLRQYFGVKTNYSSSAFYHLSLFTEPKFFSRLALFGDKVYQKPIWEDLPPLDISVTSSGWHNSGYVHPNNESLSSGRKGGYAHSVTVKPEMFEANINNLSSVTKDLIERKIKVSLVILPVHASYSDELNATHLKNIETQLERFAKSTGARYLNYINDKRFVLGDFHHHMVDHLNSFGAKKMSQILDLEVLSD